MVYNTYIKNPIFQKITNNQLSAISRRIFPNAKLEDCLEIKSGRFNTSYKLIVRGHKPVVLRIAPGASLEVYSHEKFLLKRDYSIHPYFSSISEYVPSIYFADFTHDLIDRDYMVQSFIEGVNAESVLDQTQPHLAEQLWKQLSDISEKIATCKGTGFGLPIPCLQYPKWSIALSKILEDMIQDLEKYSLNSSSSEKLLMLISNHESTIDKISTPTLIHGDMWPKNILVKNTSTAQVVGVLDTERAFWGDNRTEWIIMGDAFAGQTAQKGFVFRCGLFSEHFSQIPVSIAERYRAVNDQQFIRSQIYFGIYLTQRLLESQRFPRNEEWIESEFRNVNINLEGVV